ncbi:sulfatase family protein [Zunongwangia sp. HGR-M22]|uniref:sulfatase family protein n=1 Tax=Zunongwangia sp. HGR-M22 TaxID=3015168 RepID=UPI0022DDE464|nr:sulfatase [Zunongwangia sp. HGR-M22]WBL24965.1 sulfatase [Zunongwangia sp. HGR-M22]
MSIKKSNFLMLLLVVGALFSCKNEKGSSENKEEEATKKRPNIVFIISDDHAYQAISSYGGRLAEIAPTPNIDRISEEGMRFNNALVTNSICGPSRATILTGKYSHKNGFVDNTIGTKFDFSQQTFGELLQQAGYKTGVLGKLHLGTTPTKGFDYIDILPGQGSYYNPTFVNEEGQYQVEGYATEIITDKAIEWMDGVKNDEEPFMLFLGHKSPHRPWQPGPNELGMYEGVEIPEPETLFDDYSGNREVAALNYMSISDAMKMEQDIKITDQPQAGFNEKQQKAWDSIYDPIIKKFRNDKPTGKDLTRFKYQRYMRDYLASVAGVDKGVGKVLDYLKEAGLDENTIVIYTSDQGFYLGEHGWFDKRWMYKESLKTPLLVKWPGKVKAGTVNNDLVSNLDFAETFLDIAETKIPDDMQGRSLVPVLEGNTPEDWRDAHYYHYYEHPSEHNVRRHYGITTDKYKLIHFYYDMDVWELYDLEKDPNEMQNVYGDPAYDEVKKELHKRLEALRDKYDDNDSLNQKYIEEYKEKVKENPLVEYWKLEPEEMKRLYQEYLEKQK